MGLLFVPTGYVQIYRNRIVVRVPAENTIFEETGDFSHPRMLIGKFKAAEALLVRALASAYPAKFLKPRPALIIHPKEVLEGGLTEIEERVLTEMGLGAGARLVRIWQGADLSADEVAGFTF